MVTVRADAKFCTQKCGTYFRRKRLTLPAELTSRDSWVRFDAKKRPLTDAGTSASSTNPSTWSDFASVATSSVGVGIGLVLTGDGLGCFDLDHCVSDGQLSDEALAYVKSKNPFYVEISPSGTGIHAWVHAHSQPGWRRKVGGLSVEFYTRERYLTVTGRALTI